MQHAVDAGSADEKNISLLRRNIRRILVCQLRQIGDVLLATPSLELLARHFPGAEIHLFTEKKALPMVQGNPHIHTIWPVDKTILTTLPREIAYYRQVTAAGFDLVVDFQQLPRCRWVVAFSHAPLRLSFPPPWYMRPLYTHWAKPVGAYAAAYKAMLLAPLGIAWNGEKPRLYLSREERQQADALLRTMGIAGEHILVTVDATHRRVTRRWPVRHYAKLLDMAIDLNDSLHFLLPYGPGEQEEVRELRGNCRHANRLHIPDSMLPLRVMAACIRQAAMHFGNCSAPRHMAVAVDTPSLTILGATGGGWTYPSPQHIHIHSDLACRPCNKNTCPYDVRCLQELTPETVLPVFMGHLRQSLQGKIPHENL
jgi:heptosyltransferase-2/heptosyltransferase-3